MGIPLRCVRKRSISDRGYGGLFDRQEKQRPPAGHFDQTKEWRLHARAGLLSDARASSKEVSTAEVSFTNAMSSTSESIWLLGMLAPLRVVTGTELVATAGTTCKGTSL